MASHFFNAILSFTRFVFVDGERIYRISINTIKKMEKKDGNLFFLKEKLSLFIQRLDFNNLNTSCISRVCSTLIWSLLPYLTTLCVFVCVCVLADVQWTGQSTEIVQLVTWLPPKVARWLWGAWLYSYPKY